MPRDNRLINSVPELPELPMPKSRVGTCNLYSDDIKEIALAGVFGKVSVGLERKLRKGIVRFYKKGQYTEDEYIEINHAIAASARHQR